MNKAWWILLLLVLVLLGTAVYNFALGLRLLALMLTVLGFAGVLLKSVTFRRPRRITFISLVSSMGLSLLILAIYLLVLGVALPLILFFLGFSFGCWIGWLWAGTGQLLREAGEIKARGTWLSLLVWAAIFLTTQFLTLATGQVPLAMIILMLFGTGNTVGYNSRQMTGYLRLKLAQ